MDFKNIDIKGKIMLKTKWLVQDLNMRFDRLEETYVALSRLNFDFINFGVIPFTKSITNLENILEDDTKYILKSGTKVLTLLDNVKCISEVNEFLTKEQIEMGNHHLKLLREGVFYDVDAFDQASYGKLGLPLLNDDAVYLPVKDNLKTVFDEVKFVKPSRDLKAFNGGILEAGESFEEFIKSQQYQAFYIDEEMVVASCKKIFAEYRFFIVNQKVITYSQYKLGYNIQANAIVPESAIEVAKEYAKLYQPHDIFTLDIADTPEGFKIVEYNCWNASGTYYCDLLKIYNEVNDYMLNK